MTDEMVVKFGAAVCVETLDIPAFCGAIECALPPEAKPSAPTNPRRSKTAGPGRA